VDSLRFWKGSAYIVVVYDGYERIFKQEDADGRRLALDFETKSTRSKEPNQGVFNMYNLASTTRQEIETDAKSIRCYAGYDGEEKLIYSGDVVFVNSVKATTDWVTTMHCGDGFASFTESVTSKTFASGTDRQIILDQVAKDMGLVVKAAKDAISGTIPGAISMDGKSKDQLEVLTRDTGAEWSIQDGELNITAKGSPIDDVAIVLRADTGLLEHPTITDKGVNVKAQLNPDIRPGKLIKLEPIAVQVTPGGDESPERGKDYAGVYLCQTVQFMGNNYGGAFDVMIEAVRYDG
jgi:hypothetical protein